MKLIYLIILFSFTFSPSVAVASGGDYQEKLGGLISLSLADFYYSSKFEDGKHIELNPVFKGNPSDIEMVAFGAAGFAILYAIDKKFPGDHFLKDVLIDSVIATEKYAVNENKRIISGFRKEHRAFILLFEFEI